MSPLEDTYLAFIGPGAMAEAMISGLLREELVAPEAIIASGPHERRGREITGRYGVAHTTVNAQAAREAHVVVLAVKPQTLSHVLAELRGQIRPDALVLSIVAGARVDTIAEGLGHRKIVRVMPNTPARMGEGMSVWMCTPEVEPHQRDQAQAILGALGKELLVDHEGYLDMATALSGTGPAYVFLFMEALIDAGVHLGFSRRVAQELVVQTVRGAAAFAEQSNMHPAELRNMVTSPGGTAAEALYQLEKGGLRTVLSRAVWAAYQKSRYLGGLTDE